MKVEVLMSACKVKRIKDIVENKNVNRCIIINQMMPKEKKDTYKNITMYSYDERGLSKSRNRLLEHMTGDIEIITDDDISFVKDYEKVVSQAYNQYLDADVILFNYYKGDKLCGGTKKFKYNKITILEAISFQITFRKEKIKENNIQFDERFGIGATFTSGEENIFLSDCLKKGLKIIHIPIVICNHPDELTTGEKWTDKEIKTKGAVSKRIYKFGIMYALYLIVTKYKYYKKDYSIFEFIKLFNLGKKEYKKLKKGSE